MIYGTRSSGPGRGDGDAGLDGDLDGVGPDGHRDGLAGVGQEDGRRAVTTLTTASRAHLRRRA